MDAWLSSTGDGVIDGDGALLLCADCPCAGGVDCQADVKAAIQERQAATGRTVWTAEQAALKTLPECIDETNYLAVLFTLSPMTGGEYDAPTAVSGSYASGAADWCQLYDLLCALQVTFLTLDYGNSSNYMPHAMFRRLSGQRWSASRNSTIYVDWGDLINQAAALWALTGSTSNPPRNAFDLSYLSGYQSVVVTANASILRLYSPYCTTPRTARVYVEFNDNGRAHYNNQDWALVGVGQYAHLWTSGTWTAGMDSYGKTWYIWTSDEWPARPIPFLPYHPAYPAIGAQNSVGFAAGTLVYQIHWSFAHA